MKTRLWTICIAALLVLAGCRTSEELAWAPGTEPKPPSGPAGDLPRATSGAPSDDPLAAPPDVYGPPVDAEVTPSGLASRVLRPGTGSRHPRRSDTVVVHYTGWTTDGTRFDSSVARGEPAVFPLSGVIAGWTEGVQLMVVGEKRRFWIPAELAYGNSPRPGAPAGMLVFDVELLGIR
ncbi:MAG: FKBP-type peptidyl-prolyl cis-trans isomerase [Deltaproteobacteria bacterium]|nr:MAG: FKBP-type peptidyl-prolyl cis-trans isomerase [Deltaproteobacteria bacterium]